MLAGVPKLNEGVVLPVAAGVEVVDAEVAGVVAVVVAGFPNEKPADGEAVVVEDEGVEASENVLLGVELVAAGVVGLSEVLAPNPNVGIADVVVVAAEGFPKVAVPVEAEGVLGVLKLNPPTEALDGGAEILGVLLLFAAGVAAGDPKLGAAVEVAGAGALKDD